MEQPFCSLADIRDFPSHKEVRAESDADLSLHASDRRSDDIVVILYRALDTRYAISAGTSCFQRRPATVQAPCNVRCGSSCVKTRIFELALAAQL
jgi:hypothetical protein